MFQVQGYKIGCDFSGDGSTIASGSADGVIYFYDFLSAKPAMKMTVSREPLVSVSWHPVLPSVVACGSYDGSIHSTAVRILCQAIFTARKRSFAKVMFLQASVCPQGEVVSQNVLQVVSQHALQQVSGGGGIPACLAGFLAHIQGEVYGDLAGGRSPGPQPRGKLRGIWSRPTPMGEVEGDLAGGACSGGNPPPPSVMATAAGGTHPTGMHAYCKSVFTQISLLYGLFIKDMRILLI